MALPSFICPDTEKLLVTAAFLFPFICIWFSRSKRASKLLPMEWPLVGMTPSLLRNARQFHEYSTEVLQEVGGTFSAKGPWLAKADIIFTCDPANIKYIMNQNSTNYPRGDKYKKIFHKLGDGIFNAEGELWEFQRKNTVSLVKHQKFQESLDKVIQSKTDKGLIPVLKRLSDSNNIVDLQDIIERYTFDTISMILFGLDPGYLSVGLPEMAIGKAFHDVEAAIIYRHVLPISIWRFQRWLGVGEEKKHTKGWEIIDQFLVNGISMKHRETLLKLKEGKSRQIEEEDNVFWLLMSAMQSNQNKGGVADPLSSVNHNKLLEETVTNLVFAGRDTTSTALSWFFYLVATHPSVEKKLVEEIKANLEQNGDDKSQKQTHHSAKELSKLVYLHAALCETMRLYPPVPFLHSSPEQEDILPSGHKINNSQKAILCLYPMGRMENIWGKDRLEFRPERWISERGGIKPIPSSMFTVFGSGPRSCLGKETAFIQMKNIAIAIIYHCCIEVVEGHPIVPSVSSILQNNGIKVARFNGRTLSTDPSLRKQEDDPPFVS